MTSSTRHSLMVDLLRSASHTTDSRVRGSESSGPWGGDVAPCRPDSHPDEARVRTSEGKSTMRTEKIVVGADGTAASDAAVRWAAREATRRGAALQIVHAFDWEWESAS